MQRTLLSLVLTLAFGILTTPGWAQVVVDMPAPPKKVDKAESDSDEQPELTEAQKKQLSDGYVSLGGFLLNRGTPRLTSGGGTWAQRAINQRWRAALYGGGYGSSSTTYVYPPIGWGYGYYPYFGGWYGWGGFGHGHGHGHGFGNGFFDFGSSIHIGYEGDNFHFKVDL